MAARSIKDWHKYLEQQRHRLQRGEPQGREERGKPDPSPPPSPHAPRVPPPEAAPSEKQGGAPKRRQRIRPETRQELLARLLNPLINLHEAATVLEVSPATVRRYTNVGLLPHVRTEGNQRRFYLHEVLRLDKELRRKRRSRRDGRTAQPTLDQGEPRNGGGGAPDGQRRTGEVKR